MTPPRPHRVVVDVGNSRMKWGRLDDKGHGLDRVSLELDGPDLWRAMIAKWDLAGSTKWAIASVNPPREQALARVISEARPLETTWYRTARDVFPDPAVHVPVNAGVDRAMLVLAARARVPLGSPTLVVSCGTAITVERLDREGRWEGGGDRGGSRNDQPRLEPPDRVAAAR